MISQTEVTSPFEILTALAVMEEALEGDSSTGFMPDVTPAQASRWILSLLLKRGYRILTPGDALKVESP